MIYSGADLIRTSGQQQDRVERLRLVDRAVEPVSAPENPTSGLDENTQSALMRFARFIHKEGGGKKTPAKKRRKVSKQDNPYVLAAERQARLFDGGQILDLYI